VEGDRTGRIKDKRVGIEGSAKEEAAKEARGKSSREAARPEGRRSGRQGTLLIVRSTEFSSAYSTSQST